MDMLRCVFIHRSGICAKRCTSSVSWHWSSRRTPEASSTSTSGSPFRIHLGRAGNTSTRR
eukprot:6723627-Heterocapsa_arctica.AAC.1